MLPETKCKSVAIHSTKNSRSNQHVIINMPRPSTVILLCLSGGLVKMAVLPQPTFKSFCDTRASVKLCLSLL